MSKPPSFTPEEIQAIRHRWDHGATARELGIAYGRSAETMARIGRRETWLQVPEVGARKPMPEEADASLARLRAALEAERQPKKEELP